MRRPRRDFIFIDETGDPGPRGSEFYVCSLLHVTDADINQICAVLSSFRFLLDHYYEIHAHKISMHRFIKLNRLLRKKRRYFKCSVVYLNKKLYKGFYLADKGKRKADPNLFRKYMYRQVVDLHFSKYKPTTNHIEIVLDRSNLSAGDLTNLKEYLLRYSKIPSLDCLTETDSTYVDIIQIVDVIGFQFRPDIKGTEGISYSFINSKDISLENALGERY